MRSIASVSTANEAREALKEALRAHFSNQKVDIFSVPLESSFECRNLKRMDTITEEERPSLRIIVKLFVSPCNAQLVEDAVHQCMHELNIASLDAVILKTQGFENPCNTSSLLLDCDSPNKSKKFGCSLLQCYHALEKFHDEGKLAEIGIADIECDEILRNINEHVRVSSHCCDVVSSINLCNCILG